MQHLHFKTLNSTQKHLNSLRPTLDENILVTCEEQTDGTGQRNRAWSTFQDAIAMSFTFRPNEVVTLTSLELGVLFCRYFAHKYQKQINLKWPNDLLSPSGEKIGGILTEKANNGPCIVGIGLNLNQKNISAVNFSYPISGVFEDLEILEIKPHEMALDIYKFLLNNRLSPQEVISEWQKYCIHMDKKIRFLENDEVLDCTFKGIGEMGEAILEDGQGIIQIKYSGSIRV